MDDADKIKWNQKIFLPGFLLVFVAALAYLPNITRLGYYRDDWNLIYAGLIQGPAKFIDIYSVDRPLIGYLFTWFFYPLFGNSALGWNISAFILRVIGVLGFYWLLTLVWPGKRRAVFTAAALFAVYPGFLEQPNGIQYQPHLLNLTLYIFSLAFSVKAVQARKISLSILAYGTACFTGLISMMMMEYFVGLEGVRLALMGLAVRNANPENRSIFQVLKKTILRWLPFLILFLSFLFWRTFIFKSQRSGTDLGAIFSTLLASPVYSGLRIITEWLKDVFEVAFLSWAVPVYQLISTARLRDFILAFLLGGTAGLSVFLGLYERKRPPKESGIQGSVDHSSSFAEMMIIGVIWVFCTSLPVILAGREVSFGATLDRFAFPGSMGSALILTGLLFYTDRDILRKWIPVGLITIAVMTQSINTVNYANQWEVARDFWWQLSWRAPTLEKNTVLAALISGVPLEEDYEIWGPANMIYSPKSDELEVQAEVLNPGSVQAILMGAASGRTMRTIEVERDYANTLVLSKSASNSCLHVLDGNQPELSGFEDYRIQLIAAHSHIDRVVPAAQNHIPPVEVFGPEPRKGWCYYYQKASLAKQQNRWDEVVRLGDEARGLNLRADDWIEWLPFLQGYAYTGVYDAANSIIPIIQSAPFINQQICTILISHAAVITPGSQEETGNDYLLAHVCGIEK